MVTKLEAETWIREALRERFPKAKTAKLERETNLIATGIVDSFSFMDLLTEVEQQFGVSVDIGAHEFETLTTLGGLSDAVAGDAS